MFVLVLFSWLYMFFYSERGPQIVSSRFHKLWIQLWLVAMPSQSPSYPWMLLSSSHLPLCDFSPWSTWGCCWGPGQSVLTKPVRLQMPPLWQLVTVLQCLTWLRNHFTSPGVAEDRERQGYKCSTFLPQSTTLKVWSVGQSESPRTWPRGDPTSHSCSHTCLSCSLTFYRFFPNQSWASKSTTHCISRLWQSSSLLLTGI